MIKTITKIYLNPLYITYIPVLFLQRDPFNMFLCEEYMYNVHVYLNITGTVGIQYRECHKGNQSIQEFLNKYSTMHEE